MIVCVQCLELSKAQLLYEVFGFPIIMTQSEDEEAPEDQSTWDSGLLLFLPQICSKSTDGRDEYPGIKCRRMRTFQVMEWYQVAWQHTAQ